MLKKLYLFDLPNEEFLQNKTLCTGFSSGREFVDVRKNWEKVGNFCKI